MLLSRDSFNLDIFQQRACFDPCFNFFVWTVVKMNLCLFESWSYVCYRVLFIFLIFDFDFTWYACNFLLFCCFIHWIVTIPRVKVGDYTKKMEMSLADLEDKKRLRRRQRRLTRRREVKDLNKKFNAKKIQLQRLDDKVS